MRDSRTIGLAVEQAAKAYLEARGLRHLASNFRCRGGEIDLIMRAAQCIVFVEVRYRRSRRFGGAAASIDAGKRRRLRIAANTYLHRYRVGLPARIDVVTVDGPDIEWITNAIEDG
jgi:putative endonuclease